MRKVRAEQVRRDGRDPKTREADHHGPDELVFFILVHQQLQQPGPLARILLVRFLIARFVMARIPVGRPGTMVPRPRHVVEVAKVRYHECGNGF